jgi:hypothetical protein
MDTFGRRTVHRLGIDCRAAAAIFSPAGLRKVGATLKLFSRPRKRPLPIAPAGRTRCPESGLSPGEAAIPGPDQFGIKLCCLFPWDISIPPNYRFERSRAASFVDNWGKSMIWINQLCLSAAHSRVARLSDRGRIFGEPRRGSMIWIKQLRWTAAHSRVAQPHR